MMEPQLVVDQRGDCSVGRPHYKLEVEVLELEEHLALRRKTLPLTES